MTEFLFGYMSGLGTALCIAILISMAAASAGRYSCKPEERHPEDQPDIHLTKINSTYVRNMSND